jgi:carboxypeptidase D
MRAVIRSWSRLLPLALALWPTTTLAEGQADYFVHNLPGAPADPPVKMHAGHVTINPEHNGNIFFWHFQNHHIAHKQRTVVWLNGGPGCSSEDGALMEIGPYRLLDDKTLTYNNGSWNEFANLLFVDNPVGTGFSFVDTDSYVKELDEMANQFVQFLEKFFALFPEYEHDDLYFAGESYAGQYIPCIAKAIIDRNKKADIARKWALQGLLIGNGWISPYEQYDSYLKFAYEQNLIVKSSADSDTLQQQWRVCKNVLAGGNNHVDVPDCEKVLQDLLKLTANANWGGSQCFNMYDVRLTDKYPSCGMAWPPDLDNVTPYLKRQDVREALNIDPKARPWTECTGAVGSAFRARKSHPSRELLPEILTEMPVLLFSGDKDLICNHIGTEELIANMQWNGGKGFEVTPGNWAPRRDWTFEGEATGFWQEARNLTYVLFYNASHMVPFDLPRQSRDMLDRFLGVDVSAIGGSPADSRLDGEKGPDTAVPPSHEENAPSKEEESKIIDDAKWEAYYKSGEIVLVIAVIAAGAWGWWLWRSRRNASTQGYQGLSTGPADIGGRRTRDIEAAEFDERQLDDMHIRTPIDDADPRYSLGADSDDEAEDGVKRHNEKSARSEGSADDDADRRT